VRWGSGAGRGPAGALGIRAGPVSRRPFRTPGRRRCRRCRRPRPCLRYSAGRPGRRRPRSCRCRSLARWCRCRGSRSRLRRRRSHRRSRRRRRLRRKNNPQGGAPSGAGGTGTRRSGRAGHPARDRRDVLHSLSDGLGVPIDGDGSLIAVAVVAGLLPPRSPERLSSPSKKGPDTLSPDTFPPTPFLPDAGSHKITIRADHHRAERAGGCPARARFLLLR
jgi:hypothetical protein